MLPGLVAGAQAQAMGRQEFVGQEYVGVGCEIEVAFGVRQHPPVVEQKLHGTAHEGAPGCGAAPGTRFAADPQGAGVEFPDMLLQVVDVRAGRIGNADRVEYLAGLLPDPLGGLADIGTELAAPTAPRLDALQSDCLLRQRDSDRDRVGFPDFQSVHRSRGHSEALRPQGKPAGSGDEEPERAGRIHEEPLKVAVAVVDQRNECRVDRCLRGGIHDDAVDDPRLGIQRGRCGQREARGRCGSGPQRHR